jgi:hypothetical protein
MPRPGKEATLKEETSSLSLIHHVYVSATTFDLTNLDDSNADIFYFASIVSPIFFLFIISR